MPAEWTNNIQGNPNFAGGDMNDPYTYFRSDFNSPARTRNGMILAPLPLDWPRARELNARGLVGALD